jgi:RimJ/RimL family protein N-acetyltransferase
MGVVVSGVGLEDRERCPAILQWCAAGATARRRRAAADAEDRAMIHPAPAMLEGHGVRLEPLAPAHHDGLLAAAGDGRLWELFYTAVPEPGQVAAYVETALAGQARGEMLPWAVRDLASGEIVGSTRYHDIVPAADRVEIGYTWYAQRCQRTYVNTACKLLLFGHAFDALGCGVVGLRTDNFNFRSQRAIEALGAKKDGVIRRHWPRRDGTVRDSVMYSVLREEWPGVQAHLRLRLARHEAG